MIEGVTRLQKLSILHSSIDISDTECATVYGLSAAFSDNSEITITDITPDLRALEALADKLNKSDVEKVHFVDIIEDFII